MTVWSAAMRPGDFDALVRPNLAAMRRLAAVAATPCDSDDVVQEALARAWSRRGDYDPSRGSLRSWLLMLTHDRARSLRRRTVHHTEPLDAADALAVGIETADLDLRAAVRALPARQREVVVLFYYVDLAVDDIAAVLGISAGTVKSTLSAARKRLASSQEVSDAVGG